MKLRALTNEAYQRVSQHDQVLKKQNRGYGLAFIETEHHIFAIPLRSNLNHPHGFKTILDRETKSWNGLDYSKAIVVQEADLNTAAFKPRDIREYDKIQNNKDKIAAEFIQYLDEYIQAVRSQQPLDKKFRFTALQYFHQELGL
ncbi:MAG: type III toxin-antitoxin system TenpIN family toxin [Plesiomonas sp.]